MTELFAECRRAEVPVPGLTPGERTNYNRCKELQIKLEEAISSRNRGKGADESNNRQAGMPTASGVPSLEPKRKGKGTRKQVGHIFSSGIFVHWFTGGWSA
jgi:hypothetical protein